MLKKLVICKRYGQAEEENRTSCASCSLDTSSHDAGNGSFFFVLLLGPSTGTAAAGIAHRCVDLRYERRALPEVLSEATLHVNDGNT